MSFSPVLPSGGLSGWLFLQRTGPAQQEALANTSSVKRLTDNFKENIAGIQTAEALVADRRLLSVALQAFGLEGDLESKFYIQKVLESNTDDPDSFVNRLADKRYLKMAETFGFGDLLGSKTNRPNFANKIVAAFEAKEFEAQVGEIDPDMRLVLGLERDLSEIANSSSANDTKWFTVMGNPPLRRVFEVGLGLPSSFGTLSIDKQLEVFKDRAQDLFKTDQISELNNSEKLEDISRAFLLRSQLEASPSTGGASIALTLLQSAPRFF